MSFRDLERRTRNNSDFEAYERWKKMTYDERQAKFRAIAGIKVRMRFDPAYLFPILGDELKLVIQVKVPKISGTIAATDVGNVNTMISVARTALNVTATVKGDAWLFGTNPVSTGASPVSTPIIPSGVKYRTAKMMLTHFKGAATDAKSRITERSYKKQPSDTISISFGKKLATDSYADIIAAISATPGLVSWQASGSSEDRKKIRFVSEGGF